MNSIQITIEANEEQQEILISELSELGADGFEQTITHLVAYFIENNFPEDHVKSFIKNYSFTIQIIAEKNWNEEWESNFQPVVVDDFCAIRAEFHQPIKNVQNEIIITPKMSFGTGHHATTYMMIEQMRDIDFKNNTVFDFGTGTGILSILAEMLGAASISAIDVDDWSIQNAEENINRNKCCKIEVALSSQLPVTAFNIILANINRNVLLDNMACITKATKKGGYVLMSGLLVIDEQDIVEAASANRLQLIKQTSRNNWVCLLFVKSTLSND